MHIARVGLGISALAVAIIVVYGYLFGWQSVRTLIAPTGGLLDFYYFSIIAMAAGALAAMLAVRRGAERAPLWKDPQGMGWRSARTLESLRVACSSSGKCFSTSLSIS